MEHSMLLSIEYKIQIIKLRLSVFAALSQWVCRHVLHPPHNYYSLADPRGEMLNVATKPTVRSAILGRM